MSDGRVIVLLGPPGAGKGTQAVRLAAELGVPHVATGDLFRDNLSRGTELGERARSFMESGDLVPDGLVLDMLFDRVSQPDCAGGYVLDGFPRTVPQAEAYHARLPEGQAVAVVALEVGDETLVRRAAGRLICRDCGQVHHERSAPPKEPGLCDRCSGQLQRREDDAPETVRRRLAVYHELTAPLVEWYEARGLLSKVAGNGTRTPDDVFADLARLQEGTV